MSYTNSNTQSESFTIINARKIAAKIATDLELFRVYYGKPDEQNITDYAVEAALLLNEKSLKMVQYGFKRYGNVILSLKYSVSPYNTLVDDNPGRIPAHENIEGATFFSFLEYSDYFFTLSLTDRETIKSFLPIKRGDGQTPTYSNGYWDGQRTFSSGGVGVERGIFRAI